MLMLVDHFATDHQRPAVTVRYGRSWSLSFSLSHGWHLLVEEEDCNVFLVSLRPLGEGTAVSLMCIRPDGEAETGPRFWCKLSMERRGGDKDYNLVLMTSRQTSYTAPTIITVQMRLRCVKIRARYNYNKDCRPTSTVTT
ncbi:unnamed protein product [Triticum turgidum subsp. durum]|uniref:Uncharacterized protein n=1 Tax=Triticum turgidum subsp. durum TaxID=4567 RepID=A0A9R1RVW3_TRITD|nr:unnamed protein product [Triticum turgidum subsp. durum]